MRDSQKDEGTEGMTTIRSLREENARLKAKLKEAVAALKAAEKRRERAVRSWTKLVELLGDAESNSGVSQPVQPTSDAS